MAVCCSKSFDRHISYASHRSVEASANTRLIHSILSLACIEKQSRRRWLVVGANLSLRQNIFFSLLLFALLVFILVFLIHIFSLLSPSCCVRAFSPRLNSTSGFTAAACLLACFCFYISPELTLCVSTSPETFFHATNS